MKEYETGLYGIVIYFISKLMIEIPISALLPVTLVSSIYFTCNLNPGLDHYLNTIIITVMLSILSFMVAVFFSSLVKSPRLVLEMQTLVGMPMIIFTGLLANSSKLIRQPDSRY